MRHCSTTFVMTPSICAFLSILKCIMKIFKYKLILTLLCSFVLAGCDSTTQLSSQNKQTIKTIQINPNVVYKKNSKFYMSRAGAIAQGTGGLIGLLIEQDINNKDFQNINVFENKAHLNISKILVQNVTSVTARHKFSSCTQNSKCSYVIKYNLLWLCPFKTWIRRQFKSSINC